MKKVLEHPRIDGYNLYESAEYMQMDANGKVKGSADVATAVMKYF